MYRIFLVLLVSFVFLSCRDTKKEETVTEETTTEQVQEVEESTEAIDDELEAVSEEVDKEVKEFLENKIGNDQGCNE